MSPYVGYLEGYVQDATVVPVIPVAQGSPTMRLYVALEAPNEDPQWIDFTDRMRSWSDHRGKSSELDTMQPGRFSCVLDNIDGHLASTNAFGPYYGRLLPRRWVKLCSVLGIAQPFVMNRSVMAGTDVIGGGSLETPIFTGFSGAWPQRWSVGSAEGNVALDATDGSILLVDVAVSNFILSGNIGDAILAVLAQAGWPGIPLGAVAPYDGPTAYVEESLLDLGEGVVTPADDKALAILNKLALTDGGNFFIGRDGRAMFLKAATADKPSVGVWGDDRAAGELGYSDMIDSPEDTNLFTRVTVTSSNGTTVTLTDGAAADEFGVLSREWQVYDTGTDISDLAVDLLVRYSQPREKITSFQPEGKARFDLWRQIIPREMGDRVDTRRRPAGTPIFRTTQIEGIDMSGEADKPTDIRVAWTVSELIDPDAIPNLLIAPNDSFEGGVGDWVGLTNCVISASTGLVVGSGPDRPTPTRDGVYALMVNPDWGTGSHVDATLKCNQQIPVTVGESYIAGISSYAGTPGPAHVDIEWYDSANALITTTVAAGVVGHFHGWWSYRNGPETAPAGATYAKLLMTVNLRLPGVGTGPPPVEFSTAAFLDRVYFKGPL